jgi:septum formation protein
MAPAFPSKPKLILASASPRRLDLLAQIGVVPDLVRGVDADETILKDEAPRAAVERLARVKAEAATGLRRSKADLILTADTIVACGRRILGKPNDIDDARRMLELLSGRRHRVMSALCLVAADDTITSRTVVTRVSFKRLSGEELEAYLASGEWEGKAGAYAIQGRADSFVRSLEGSYSNVVGLPLHETANLLNGAGFRVLEGWAPETGRDT